MGRGLRRWGNIHGHALRHDAHLHAGKNRPIRQRWKRNRQDREPDELCAHHAVRLMAVPTAPNNAPPVTLGPWGPRHQVVKATSGISSAPTSITPAPVAQIIQGGTLNVPYSETITTSGGTSPYAYSVTGGSLPTGTSLNTSSGVITGTP